MLKIKDRKAFTIKVLSRGGERKINEVNIISRLYYIG